MTLNATHGHGKWRTFDRPHIMTCLFDLLYCS